MDQLGFQRLPPRDGCHRFLHPATGLIIRRPVMGSTPLYLTEVRGSCPWSVLAASSDVIQAPGAEVAVYGDVAGIYRSNGSRMVADGCRTRGYTHGADVTTAAGTTEQVLAKMLLPKGRLKNLDMILVFPLAFEDSGTGDTFTVRFRLGTTGTIADTQLVSLAPAASQQSAGTGMLFKRLSATSIRQDGAASGAAPLASTVSTAGAAAITVADMDANDLWLSFTSQSSASANTLTLRSLVIDLLDYPG